MIKRDIAESLVNGSRNKLIDVYSEWVNNDKYMLCELTDNNNNKFIKGYLLPKRGNIVYSRIMKNKLNEMKERIRTSIYFNEYDRRRIQYTPVIRLTLTYDPKKIKRFDAWKNVGIDLNRYLSKIRKKFMIKRKGLSHIRSYEAQWNGYPHIHIDLIFKDRMLETRFGQWGLRGWRLARRDDNNKLKDSWGHGIVDIVCVSGINGFSDVITKSECDNSNFNFLHDVKYYTKDLSYVKKGKAVYQSALLWIMHKRSFSFSKDFMEIYDKICERLDFNALVNSNLKKEKDKKNIVKIVRLGIFDRGDVKEELLRIGNIIIKGELKEQFIVKL